MTISRLIVLSADCSIDELLETLKLMKLKPKQAKFYNNDYYLEYDNPRKPQQAEEIILSRNLAKLNNIMVNPQHFPYNITILKRDFQVAFSQICNCLIFDRTVYHEQQAIKMCYFDRDQAHSDYRILMLFKNLEYHISFETDFPKNNGQYFWRLICQDFSHTMRFQYESIYENDDYYVLIYHEKSTAVADYLQMFPNADREQILKNVKILGQDEANLFGQQQFDRNYYIKVTSDLSTTQFQCQSTSFKGGHKVLVYDDLDKANTDLIQIETKQLLLDYIFDGENKELEQPQHDYQIKIAFGMNISGTKYLATTRKRNNIFLYYDDKTIMEHDLRYLQRMNDGNIAVYQENKPIYYPPPEYYYIDTDNDSIKLKRYNNFKKVCLEQNRFRYYYENKEKADIDFQQFLSLDPTVIMRNPQTKIIKHYREPNQDVVRKYQLYSYCFDLSDKHYDITKLHYSDLSLELAYLKFFYSDLKIAARDAKIVAKDKKLVIKIRNVATGELIRTVQAEADKQKVYCSILCRIDEKFIRFLNLHPFCSLQEHYKILIFKNQKAADFMVYQFKINNMNHQIGQILPFEKQLFETKTMSHINHLSGSKMLTSAKQINPIFEIHVPITSKLPAGLQFVEQTPITDNTKFIKLVYSSKIEADEDVKLLKSLVSDISVSMIQVQ